MRKCLLVGRMVLPMAMVALWVRSGAEPPGSANPVQVQDDEVRLDRLVTATLAAGTLADVLREVSRQTDVAIEPADYLADRRLSVQFTRTPARDLLDAIAELYDWSWRVRDDGRVVVERRQVRTPRSVGEIGPMIRKCLPVDIRAFLGHGQPDRDLRLIVDGAPEFAGSEMSYRPAIPAKLEAVSAREGTRLGRELLKLIPNASQVPFAKLPADLRQSLTFYLVVCALMIADYGHYDSMPIPPYASDLSQAVLHGDGGLAVTSVLGSSGQAFGFGSGRIKGP